MNALDTLLAHPSVAALGLALLHFVWQGALVALLLAIVLRVLRQHATNARYIAGCVALLLMAALPLTTMIRFSLAAPRAEYTAITGAVPNVGLPMMKERELASAAAQTETRAIWYGAVNWSQRVTPLLPWLSLLWLIGVTFFSLRFAGGWLYTRRLRRRGVRLLDDAWQETMRRLRQQLLVARPAQLLESALVTVPTVIGWLRPVILLPLGVLTNLTLSQLEAILAHELAHIRRHDYLVNMLQAVIETLLFYHPAVWWISRQIRQEREQCCDDLAVAACGDAMGYARALFALEEFRAATPSSAMAANGGSLSQRIERLVGVAPPSHPHLAGWLVGLFLLSVAVGAQMLSAESLPTRPKTESRMAVRASRSASELREVWNVPLARRQRRKDVALAHALPSKYSGATSSEEHNGKAVAQDQNVRDKGEPNKDQLKETVIIALGQLNNEQARAKLREITRNEQRFYLRERAMDELARRSDADMLSQLYSDQTEDRLKERVIIALGQLNDAQAMAQLREITRNDKTFYLRERALIELSRGFGAGALSRLYDEQTEALFKERILNLLSQMGGKTSLEKLFAVAQGDSSPLLRQTAIRLLGRSKDPAVVKLLEQLI